MRMTITLSEARGLYPPAGLVFDLKIRYRSRVMDTGRVLAHVSSGESVLDIGCGTGLLLTELALRGHRGRLLGVDVSRGALALAEKAAVALAARGSDAPEFRLSSDPGDWPQGPFGVVCMVDVMHHVPPAAKEAFLAAALSRVAPGGTFVYKDMAMRPWVCAQANRLHDLVLSGDRISYHPLGEARRTLLGRRFRITASDAWRQLWYAHELLVAVREG
jgi:SAM-dependent methyltransferase